MDNPRQEQFETHMENLAVDLEPILNDHFTKLPGDQQVIFAVSFVITEYFLHRGFTPEQIELMMAWGKNSKINDWNNTRG